jgi:signal transduction histidine kinase
MAYLAGHEEHLRRDLSRLAAWPQDHGRDLGAEVERLLAYAGPTLGARRLVMLWEEREEPWVHVARWTPAGFDWSREPPDAFGPLAPDALARATFLCPDVGSSTVAVIRDGRAVLQRLPQPPLSAGLVQRLGIRHVLSAPLDGETFAGRLLAVDNPDLSPDDLVLAEIVAHYVAAAVDRAYFLAHLSETVTLHERARVAHDLHDGGLQALTAIELKLAGLAAVAECPAVLAERLESLRAIVREEHADLRRFVRALPAAPGAGAFELERQLELLPARIARQWDLPVKLSVDRLPPLPAPFAREAYLVVREAIVNAARHAHASLVTVEVGAGGEALKITVTDDGRGFGVEGRFDHEELRSLAFTPSSVRARVEGLGGRLALESSGAGARLEIVLPLGAR